MIRTFLFAFITILILQIIVIGYLSQTIYTRLETRRKVLGIVNVSPISKDNLVASPSSEFKYYYTLPIATQSSEFRYWEGSDGLPITYNYNHDGLHDRFDYNIFKPEGVFRIVTLGASFTYGSLVNTQNNWTEVIEDMLNNQEIYPNIKKVEVINLGVWGFDVPYIIKRYEDIGTKYNPDLVIWFETEMGFTRDMELITPKVQDCINNIPGSMKKTIEKEFDCWEKAEKQVIDEMTYNKMEELIENYVKKFLSSKGITPFLFASFSNLSSRYKRILQNRTNYSSNIYTMTSVSDINTKGGTFGKVDGHPNEKGHKIIATDIFNYLIKNKQKFFQM